MLKKLFFLILALLLNFSPLYCDTIYFYKDKNGVLHFTDMPTSSKFKPYISYYSFLSKKDILNLTKRISKKYKVDPLLIIAILKVESNLEVYAKSPKGAQGLMQIMPSTQQELNIISPYDPEENIEGGIRYFTRLLKKYKSIKLALAAYNAGPRAVDKYKGIPPFKETRKYIDKVLKEYNKLKSQYLSTGLTQVKIQY